MKVRQERTIVIKILKDSPHSWWTHAKAKFNMRESFIIFTIVRTQIKKAHS